jgi:nucleoid-associated protein YgaU
VDRSAVDRDAGGGGASASAAAAGAGAAVGAAGLSGETPAEGRRQNEPDRGLGDDDRAAAERESNPPRRPARRARAYEQHLGGTDGPDWERPRRYEAYPSIRTRVALPNMSRLAVMAGAIAIAALALFFLPALLGIGGTGNPAGASAGPSASATRPSLQPTDPPAPTPFLYTIKKNETLSRIATAHGITLAELLAANPQIKNPNKITEGQQITIPTPSGGPPSQAPGSASPSAS